MPGPVMTSSGMGESSRIVMGVLGAAVALIVLLFVVSLARGGDDDPTPVEASDAAAREAQPGIFYTTASYRATDTRADGRGKLGRSATDAENPGLPRAEFVRIARDGDGTPEFPAEAIAVAFNVTVTETEGIGFVQIDGYAFAGGDTSTVNWTGPGQTVANSGIARLTDAFGDPGAIGVYLDGSDDARAHVLIDVTGYYMPLD